MRIPKSNNVEKPRTTTRKAVKKAIDKQDLEQKAAARPVFTQEDLHNAICLKAYELFVAGGCQVGKDLEDWYAAERIVLSA